MTLDEQEQVCPDCGYSHVGTEKEINEGVALADLVSAMASNLQGSNPSVMFWTALTLIENVAAARSKSVPQVLVALALTLKKIEEIRLERAARQAQA